MLLRAKDRRWLSSDVQSDVLLVCTDGSVPAHSALLANSSTFLSNLLSQPSTSYCAGCSSPRRITMAGVGVGECRSLIELLYTGRSSTSSHVAEVLALSDVLGMKLQGLSVNNKKNKTTLASVADKAKSEEYVNHIRPQQCDQVDVVHPRFTGLANAMHACNSNQDVNEDPNPSIRVSGLTTRTLSPLKALSAVDSLSNRSLNSQILNSSPLRVMKTYQKRRRYSNDNLAEPLRSFPLEKLPFKEPDVSDNILPEISERSQVYKEISKTNSHAVLQYLQSPQVMLPDTILSEVMHMQPQYIKQEVEEITNQELSSTLESSLNTVSQSRSPKSNNFDTIDNSVDQTDSYPQLEGRDDDNPSSPPVTAYLSMANTRNYVCEECDKGFTFIRSFNWHRKRCQEAKRIKSVEKKKISNERPQDTLVNLDNVEVKVVKIPTKQCIICNKSVNSLKSHLTLVHFKDKILSDYCSKSRQCKICKKVFKSLHGLILHVGVHHNVVKSYVTRHTNRIKRFEANHAKRKDAVGEKAGIGNTNSNLPKKRMIDKKIHTEKVNSGGTMSKNSKLQLSVIKKQKNVSEKNTIDRKRESKVTKKLTETKNKLHNPRKSVLKNKAEIQLSAIETESTSGRKVSCGECVKCLLPDCGQCFHCSDKPEFGGKGKLLNKTCVKKVCRNKIWSEVVVTPTLVLGSKRRR